MRERVQQVLRIVCLMLACLIVLQLVGVVKRVNPLAHVRVPDLPSLPDEAATNQAPRNHEATHLSPALALAKAGTNHSHHPGRTNSALGQTNVSQSAVTTSAKSNSIARATGPKGETNALAAGSANSPLDKTNGAPAQPAIHTPSNNAVVAASRFSETNAKATAGAVRTLNKTNQTIHSSSPKALAEPRTHQVSPKTLLAGGAIHSFPPGMHPPGSPMEPHRMMGGRRGPAPPLPAAIQARVDRITESEILGPVIHPLPMALLGIAGNDVFLRAPDGQTGLVEVGHTLGGIKLLKIGINRVLIEQNGQKKELTIFAGVGGESLLSKKKEHRDETTKK